MPRRVIDPEPTPKQWEILAFMLKEASRKHNFPSSYAIAGAVGISQTRVMMHLGSLEDKGYVISEDGKLRLVEGVYIPPERLKSVFD